MLSGNLYEIKKYVDSIKDAVALELSELEKICIDGRNREKDPVPIYFTKWRVKKPESVFLKTKRKNKSYQDLSDYGGMRLLCLFEQDILKVHDFLLGVLVEKKYDLHECNVYNFSVHDDLFYGLKESTEKHFPGNSINVEEKQSGYKSIHYLAYSEKNVIIEIQLRTLVQDVWGELEHTLSYKKGYVHPYIKKSFLFLATELQNIDDLLSHLREIGEKEAAGKKYSSHKDKPLFYFEYEDQIYPSLFVENDSIREKHEKYLRVIKKLLAGDECAKKVRTAYVELSSAIMRDFSCEKLDYWFQMEEAFLLFCEASYDQALEKYTEILNSYPDRYCVYYRMGELYFIKEQSEEALNCFDIAELLLDQNDDNHSRNRYRIKSRLAFIYWSLGEEYIDIAIKEIAGAEKIYYSNKGHLYLLSNDISL